MLLVVERRTDPSGKHDVLSYVSLRAGWQLAVVH